MSELSTGPPRWNLGNPRPGRSMSKRISLEAIHIPNPCPANWNAMAPAPAGRFCASCQKHVYDFSALTRDEAEALVCQSAGKLCVRMQHGRDGRVITLDYQQDPATRRGWRFWTGVGLVAGLMAWTLGAILGRGGGRFTGVVAGGIGGWPVPATPVSLVSAETQKLTPLPPPLAEHSKSSFDGRSDADVPLELRVR